MKSNRTNDSLKGPKNIAPKNDSCDIKYLDSNRDFIKFDKYRIFKKIFLIRFLHIY